MLEHFLQEFLIIFAVATAVATVCRLIKLPTMVGFILSGVLVGPSGFQLLSDPEVIQQIAELGLVFLLFSIGVEFSLKHLLQMKRVLLGGGTVQFLLVSLSVMAFFALRGIPLPKAFFMGSLVALSSTAIVLKSLHSRRELATPHGNLAVGILLFQDLMVVPLMLLIPLLAPESSALHSEAAGGMSGIWELFIKAGGIVIVVVAGSRYVIPFVFKLIAQSGGRELFIIAVALLILFSAWAAQKAGLSLALGAFIAGILISESPYGHQATAEMIAWRDPLVAIFFVSVGMLLDVKFLLQNPWSISLATLVILFGKTVLNSIAGSLLGYMQRASVVAGLLLSQVGEFSFILADSAQKAGVLSSDEYQFFLSVIVLSLSLSPLIIHLTPLLAPRLIRSDFVGQAIEKVIQERQESGKTKENTAISKTSSLKDHVVIIGFGNNGQNLAAALRHIQVPYQIIESNAATLQAFPQEPIHFGDGGKPELLESVGIESARAVVITINDAIWIHKIVAAVRRLRPDIRMVVRLQYFLDAKRCDDLEGVDRVIAEAETAKQIVRKVLAFYEVSPEEMKEIVG